MQVITHRKHAVNMTKAERIASAVGGGLLAAAGIHSGIARRPAAGILMALVGGDLLRRGITGHSYAYEAMGVRTAPVGQGAEISVPYELGIRADASITIGRPRQVVYRFWRSISNLARVMENVEAIEETAPSRSHWVVRGPAGRRLEWDAVIHNEAENEMIAWRSLDGADMDHAGSVWFKDAPGGRGTEVRVEMQYNPPAGVFGALVASMAGKEPSQQIRKDLYRLKSLLETGEVITTEGQSSGRARFRRERDRLVQEASEASFPASDAPAYNPSAI